MRGERIVRVRVRVNETLHELDLPASSTLADLLRDRLGLTGTKVGCNVGECGACTVLLDSAPVLACLVLAPEVDGCEVTTVEAAGDARISRLQRAFVEEAGLQCGFCTPGMVMAASRLRADSDAGKIRAALAGNICRCTGYQKIVNAVARAIGEEARGGKKR
jgi:aerobic-type carbon monoxide dehydrogenase small subunit (CoxS/CutS family)